MTVSQSWNWAKRSECGLQAPSVGGVCLELAVLAWGFGYLLNALDAPTNGGQILDFNAFGSSVPLAILFQWGSLTLGMVALVDPIMQYGRNTKWGGLIFGLWAGTFVLVLAEGVLRASAIVMPETQGFPTYSTELWKRKYVSLNGVGFRDFEHDSTAQPGALRLLVVGDSYAFGWGLNRIEDRFGEQLVEQLVQRTQAKWESINNSRGDTHTLQHIELLMSGLAYQPDVILLLYVFNDIDYLVPVTPRVGQSEHATSFLERIHPVRLLFKNFYLFQAVYVRFRLVASESFSSDGSSGDPYGNDSILASHLEDLARFVSAAAASKAVVAIVPFETGVVVSKEVRGRYDGFVKAAGAMRLPVWPITEEAFEGHDFADLVVNKLDRHPNELAHRLAAENVVERVLSWFGNKSLGEVHNGK